MPFAFTDEQCQLRDAVRSFFTSASSEAEVRRVMETEEGYDSAVWARAAAQLGLQGLAIPEEHGGSGGGPVELAIALEEMGRRLVPGPYLSTALAVTALLEAADEAVNMELLPGIADGSVIATLAVAEAAGTWSSAGVSCAAAEDGRLTGVKEFVTDGHVADVLVVAARGPRGLGLHVVRASDPGVRAESLTSFDRTRRLARVHLEDVPSKQLAGADADVLDRVLLRCAALLAAEQVGAAQEALDMAVEYAKYRVQFGRAIGSFQAIKHLLADTLLEVESARSAAYYAAWSVADGLEDLPTVAPLAQAYCSDALMLTARNTMQVHGGISFTWEHPAHLYYRRAKSTLALLGSPREHREQLAQRLGLQGDAHV